LKNILGKIANGYFNVATTGAIIVRKGIFETLGGHAGVWFSSSGGQVVDKESTEPEGFVL